MKTKFQVLVAVVIALSLIAGAGLIITKLTFKNKSGLPVAVQLTPVDPDKGLVYYFDFVAGTKADPVEKVYTLIPAKYNLVLYAGDPLKAVNNPFCLPAKDIDKSSAGIQIELTKANMTMVFLECLKYEGVPASYNTNTGFWKDLDGLWRAVFKYVYR
jgi:hypothetical protein